MRHHLRSAAVVAAASASLLVVSCDRNPGPTRPSPTPSGTQTPTVTVVRVEVVAPESIEPGTTAQVTANAVKSDGTVENVTASAQWFSGNTGVLRVESAGVVRAVNRGETTINARYQSRTGSSRVFSLPPGTFKLNGVVTDTGIPLQSVSIAVIGGTGQGLTAVTNPSGGYSLYGVAGEVRLHAKKDGYLNRIETVQVSGHRSLDFAMALDGERPDLRGVYRLTLTAGCQGSELPEEARERAYTATVEQVGPQLTVRLSGADFIVTSGHGNGFIGLLTGNRATFQLGTAYYYYFYYYGQYDLVERLGPSLTFVATGFVSASAGGSSLSGTLTGTLMTGQGSPPGWRILNQCYSSNHRFEMRRQ